MLQLIRCLFPKKNNDCSRNRLQINCPCVDSESLSIFNEINQIYEQKLKSCDKHNRDDWELKASILKEWVGDLLQQNCLMINIMERLEEEAIQRINIKCACCDASTVTDEIKTSGLELTRTSDETKPNKQNCAKCITQAAHNKELDKIQRCLDKKLCEKQQELYLLKKKVDSLNKKYSNCKFETQLKTDIINTMRKDVKKKLMQNQCQIKEFK